MDGYLDREGKMHLCDSWEQFAIKCRIRKHITQLMNWQ